ncbi:MAG TPA: metallophosphoesterase, partial [Thermoanaerobaculia bacterium]|nr:metallophosphoesterase [Thermoanaerobaculia bacterium]
MPSSSSRSLLALAALLIVAGCASVGPQRTVAVGDIHGEYDGFVSILRQAGVVDERLRWTDAGTTLVQTGDYVDRGAETRKVMDLLMKLERARRSNVIVLLGNHELMNITRNLADVNPAQYAAFADGNSERRRQAGYRDYAALRERLARRYAGSSLTVLSEDEWMAAHPPGFIEYAEALSRNGVYGRWLRTKRVMVKVGDSIFMHAGI